MLSIHICKHNLLLNCQYTEQLHIYYITKCIESTEQRCCYQITTDWRGQSAADGTVRRLQGTAQLGKLGISVTAAEWKRRGRWGRRR
jgi:hypothetical protein